MSVGAIFLTVFNRRAPHSRRSEVIRFWELFCLKRSIFNLGLFCQKETQNPSKRPIQMDMFSPVCHVLPSREGEGAMSKAAAAAATPAAGVAALACGNAACGKALAPPLLQCSKCKAEAYCCKACQVGDPAAPAAHRAPRPPTRACSLTRARSFLPECTPPPPPDRRVEGRAQARVRCAGAGRGGGAAPARRAGGSAS